MPELIAYQPTLDDLREVNRLINTCPFKPDPPDFDDWRPADEKGGDCDSLAVAKLRALHKRGWPIKDLRLATCWVETGEYHCVLIARLNGVDYLLDNRSDTVVDVDHMDPRYKTDRVQANGGRMEWMEWTGVTV